MTSVISTIKNEIDSIEGFLKALSSQKGIDELVIVDGGSTDGTIEVLQKFAETSPFTIQLIIDPEANIAKGRNIAIQAAHGDIIAVTDAGCEVGDSWLEQITAPLRNNPTIGVVSGFFKVHHNRFAHNVLSAVTIPPIYEIEAGRFLPSSRSLAFRKSIWQNVSKYPEWLPICEDVVFDLKLKRSGVVFDFNSRAWVVWYVRDSWIKYFWQYYRYARGDGHAKLWPRRHMIRYSTYFTAMVFFALSVVVSPYFFLAIACGFILYMTKFWRRFFHHYPDEKWWVYIAAVITMPLLVIAGDIAKMLGYPIGRWQRYTGVIHSQEY